MARYGLSIEKTMLFRGVQQHFGNTYYFAAPIGEGQTTELNALIDAVLAIDRNVHANNVTYTRARLWTADGGPAANHMVIDRALSGVGAAGTTAGSMDRERAYLVRFRAGVDTKGRPVYLRKWWHCHANSISGVSPSAGNLENLSTLSSTIKTFFEGQGNALKTIPYTTGQNWDLVGPTGRAITGSTQCHDWLEHHQLGDEWRGA